LIELPASRLDHFQSAIAHLKHFRYIERKFCIADFVQRSLLINYSASRVGLSDANLPLPGKVEAITAMRPINGNEAGATWFAPNRAKLSGETMTTHTAPSPGHNIGALSNQFRMTHTFHLVSDANEPLAGQLESALKSARAQVEKWVISRRGGRYEHCIIVEDIGEDSARELRRKFASLSGEIKVRVEHMLHFEREAATPKRGAQ
jgi:hypothetical protein